MTDADEFEAVPRPARPWVSAALGASAGLLAAAVGIFAWTIWRSSTSPELPPHRDVAQIGLFRLPADATREALLLPAGPDAIGEPRLAVVLFPGETPPRELATLLLANVSRAEPWDVDLAAARVRGRVEGGAWEEFQVLAGRAGSLGAADGLRLRALGGDESRVTVGPSSLRQVLLALPPRRKIADLTDVEWGGRALTRDSLPLERIRRFREDPAAAVTGR